MKSAHLKVIIFCSKIDKKTDYFSCVYEVTKGISSLFIFFFEEKFLGVQKPKSRQNQPTKQKQAINKQQRQSFFAHKNF